MSTSAPSPAPTLKTRPSVRLRTAVDRIKSQKTPIQPSPLLGLNRVARQAALKKRKSTQTRWRVAQVLVLLTTIVGLVRFWQTGAAKTSDVFGWIRWGLKLGGGGNDMDWNVVYDRLTSYASLKAASSSPSHHHQHQQEWEQHSFATGVDGDIGIPIPNIDDQVDEMEALTHHHDHHHRIHGYHQLSSTDSDDIKPPTAEFIDDVADKDENENDDAANAYLNLPEHHFGADGLLSVNPDGPHPIWDLVDEAEQHWEQKLNASSKTLEQAVAEYAKRYKRAPPKGFDLWWSYVQEHSVLLPDEYDQIHHDLEPLWGLSPSYISSQSKARENDPNTFTIICVRGRVQLKIDDALLPTDERKRNLAWKRARGMMDLLTPVEEWLPDFRATFSTGDSPTQVVPHVLREKAVAAAAKRTTIMPAEVQVDMSVEGWAAACPPNSVLGKQSPGSAVHLAQVWAQRPKTFVWEHQKAMDPCANPLHVHLHGLLADYNHTSSPISSHRDLYPIFSPSTTSLHSDIVVPSMDFWEEDVGPDPEWDRKPRNKVNWKGSNTGIPFRPGPSEERKWRHSQRVRVVEGFNSKQWDVDWLKSTVAPGDVVGVPVEGAKRKELNERLMDVAFVGEPVQCKSKEEGGEPAVCAYVKRQFRWVPSQSEEEGNFYKYELDVDGDGPSSRFKRLMTTNSLVLKTTIFQEWYLHRIQPWVHYIPVKNEMTDLYDIMTFFRGNSDDERTSGHDSTAREIATHGKEWSKRLWRKEDMVAYMFRLFLEYGRVISPHSDVMSFGVDVGEEGDEDEE